MIGHSEPGLGSHIVDLPIGFNQVLVVDSLVLVGGGLLPLRGVGSLTRRDTTRIVPLALRSAPGLVHGLGELLAGCEAVVVDVDVRGR